jgi:5-hydroxyisourate hydrolase
MGKLSTHVLDTTHGKPASGVSCRLYRLTGERRQLLVETRTNEDGRCDKPLLEGDDLIAGTYELDFAIGDYFALSQPRFLDVVTVRFGIGDPTQNYHVPLVTTPWSYSTYRGS